MWLELIFLLLLALYLTWNYIFGNRVKNYPPGPWRFPFLGNLRQFGQDPVNSLAQWKAKYGNIVGLRFGDFNVVVLNTYEVIKEAFDKQEFSGRPELGPLMIIAGGKKQGLLMSEGQAWSEQRRFALRNLRDFGFGKKSMEGVIQEDVNEFISSIKKEAGTPIATKRRLSLVVLSALWNIVSGEKFAHDDLKFKVVLDGLNAAFESTSVSGAVFFMPKFAKFLPKFSGFEAFSQAIRKVKSLVGNTILEHQKTYDAENMRDFMDVYLKQIHTTVDPESSFYKKTGDSHMLVAMVNLFGAGGETTSNTLNWAFYFLSQNQNVQKKLQKELDEVVGRSRLPGFDDRETLVYANAVVLEVFRKSSFVPFGVFHDTLVDVKFHGFDIPKNTVIMANLYDVHHDKEVWEDPDVFRPERFLSADGKTLEKVGHVIPFSVGKRFCLGETLARNVFFLMLTSTVQRFEIIFDPKNIPNDKPHISLFRFPAPFKVIFRDRFDD